MRWRGKRQSSNVEDRRGMSGGSGGGGAGLIIKLLPMLFRFLGFKGSAVAVLAIAAFSYFGGGLDGLGSLLGGAGMQSSMSPQKTKTVQQSAEEKELVKFVATVLADTEDSWHTIFKAQGKTYKEPRLVLFRGATQSACGQGQAAMGPFYCPADQKVYIDLSFYNDLKNRYKAPGDFAQAYVLAHEVGHHVQTLMGISGKVRKAKQGLSKIGANKLSVRQELQADCFAGIWAHHAKRSRDLLEQGDVEEALTAASAIGDDRLQQQAQGRITPDSFTHGSSAQRIQWFKTGLTEGSLASCNTF